MKLPGFLCSVLMAAVCSGCANVHLYSEDRDKQGQALTKAWAEVDVPAYFKSMRTERAKLVGAEYDQIAEHALATRNSYARLIAEHPINAKAGEFGATGLNSLLASDLKKLAGPASLSDLKKVVSLEIALASLKVESRFAENAFFVASRGIRATCDSLKSGVVPVVTDDNAESLLTDLKKQCQSIEASSTARREALVSLRAGGELGDAIGQYNAFLVDRNDKIADVKTAREAAELAAAAYKAAVGTTKVSAENPSKDIIEKAGALQAAVKKLVDARNAFADQTLASANVDRLNAILASIKDGKASSDAGTIEELAAVIPNLADDVRELQRTASLAPQASLQLRLQLEQAKLQRANARVQLIDKKINAANDLVRIRVENAYKLKGALDGLISLNLLDTSEFIQVVSDSAVSAPNRIKVAGTALVLLDSQINHRAAAERKLVEMISLEHEQSIMESEANAEQYRILIAAIASQAAAYAASGIRLDDVTKIVNAVAFLWIGHGVNK